MPFFLRPQAAFPQEDIFSILSALDESSCAPRKHARQTQREQTFTPRFDILETPTAYELYGEVPGLEKESLTIEFEDAQTLVLKGRTARPTASSLAAAAAEAESEKAAEVHAEQEKEHQASVEDDYDEADTPLATPASASSSSTATAAPEEKAAETPKPRYWVSERRVGTFARSFSFSQRLEFDAVSAELKEGVLHVVVPKSGKSKKVAVSVF